MRGEAIVTKLEGSKDVPTIGPVASEVMRLTTDPDATFHSVGRVIERDPALTARVLRIANSPYYGLRGEVATVDRAVGLLGLVEVRNIALSISVIRDFSARFGKQTFNWEGFWEHSSGCALIAQVLSKLLRLPTQGQEYVGALLHDVGKILLGHHFPQEFAQALEMAAAERLTMEEAEQHVFDMDHGRLGRWLGEQWDFPTPISEAIAHHHHPERATEGKLLAAVVHLSDLLAKAKCIGFGGDDVAVCLSEDPAWTIVADTRADLASMDLERFTFELDRQVDAARELTRTSRAA